ncbi:hypothetical protein [Thermoactinomyces sp. DSM 45892]|uniref:hypothetical protein n=1 Tax=Thermoactinomyces sp. DSM 45892 TaxID=1882753 RepID=UPI000896E21A|nr:hypothetical protein [Thermoactinomyces sp. DSM 45892]SDY69021.1 hypothetical protein SAMN05444416_10784 [Thermoactinomyces sp. DSM 45892]
MSGRRSKNKGYRTEKHFAELVEGKRVIMSGALKNWGYELAGDVEGKHGEKWEIKARADGFKQLYRWLDQSDGVDLLALKADRKPFLVVMELDTFLNRYYKSGDK